MNQRKQPKLRPFAQLREAELQLRRTSAEIRALIERLDHETRAYNRAVTRISRQLRQKLSARKRRDNALWIEEAAGWLEADPKLRYHKPGWDDPPIHATDQLRFIESLDEPPSARAGRRS
jgi:hypothetical protein